MRNCNNYRRYYPACFAVDISSPQFIRLSDPVKSATFPGDVVTFPGIINTLFPVSAKIQGVPLVYSGSGCTGPYAPLYDDSSSLCDVFFPDGSTTNDVVTSILVPPFIRLELFPECAQPTGECACARALLARKNCNNVQNV